MFTLSATTRWVSCVLEGNIAGGPLKVSIELIYVCLHRYADPRTEIGVVVGTGTNASCVEKVRDIRKWVPGLPSDVLTAVNIEWGAFASEHIVPSDIDLNLDTSSQHPGKTMRPSIRDPFLLLRWLLV